MRWDITSKGVLVYCELENNTTELTIPEGVKIIGERVFQNFLKLKSVRIPEGVVSIKGKAFFNCTSLVEIQFPESIEEIWFNAFRNCWGLKRVPVLAHEGKIFYQFPEFDSGLFRAEYMIQNHDYQLNLIPEAKHDLIFQMFALNMDTTGTGEYIQKHFSEMIPILIRLNDSALLQKLQENLPDVIQKHIDMLIQEAIRQEKHELQIMLTDYKYQHNLFDKKDWSLS